MLSISFRQQRDEKKENNLLTLIIIMSILFARVIATSTAQFAEYGRTRRDLASAEAIFAPFSFKYLDKSRACTCHTLQTGQQRAIVLCLH